MDYLNYAIFALLLLFVLIRFVPVKGIRNISASELKNELNDKQKQFIDVRTTVEFNRNHIRGFKNVPLHQLSQKSKELAKDKEVVVICQSGMRSMKASKELKKLGFTQITNVKGGVSAWRP
ncbi:rhodanese-like domain-containing protein [Bacillus sp. FJAT-27251]|uniref:rhodanese-like domain-containing protein n=1 Tax=Bacillus sp. FJAT-27251 TaxID=1684142 RepID=UPI0006A77BC2|nr:rhodanese-like domain-containing protein [Bacillus sp. FJAT-27251]